MKDLVTRLKEPGLITVPGIFDLVSAKIAETFGFDALYMTGFGVVASHLGLPDAGLASYADMVDRLRRMVETVATPIIADGDTGYGGLLNVDFAVRGYEKAGAAAIQIEDQEFPKKCGHTPQRRVVPLEDASRRIRVAREARSSSRFLIVARTDARTAHGLDEALRRGEAFLKAGADILFIESPKIRRRDAADRASVSLPPCCQYGRGRTDADPVAPRIDGARFQDRSVSDLRPPGNGASAQFGLRGAAPGGIEQGLERRILSF